MWRQILAAIGRALKSAGRFAYRAADKAGEVCGWIVLDDLPEPVWRAIDAVAHTTVGAVKGVGKAALGGVGLAAGTAVDLVGSVASAVVGGGGGGYMPPEPTEDRLPKSGYTPRNYNEDQYDMSPSWYAVGAYIVGGKVFDYPGVKEDFEALAKTAPDVHSWALSLSQTERDLVKEAGFVQMIDHLKSLKPIEGVRIMGRRRIPDGILDTPTAKARPVAFELADGYDVHEASLAPAL